MSDIDRQVSTWLKAALRGETAFGLDQIAALVLPVSALRDLCRKHDRVPKGYRIEKAPARRLAVTLCEPRHPEVLESLVRAVVERLANRDETDADKLEAASETERLNRLLGLRDQELSGLRTELERSREQEAEHRRRAESLQNERRFDHSQIASLRAELDAMRSRLDSFPKRVKPADRSEVELRVRELESELDTMSRSEEGLRRLVAIRQARIRDLEDRVAELLEQTRSPKKGQKPKPQDRPEAPLLSETFRVPQFTQSFYKSLDGKPRQSVEKAFQAALLFCIEGPSYPGLEVKQIGGQDLWSLRASRKLRVYFLPVGSQEVEFLSLVDREDQPTALRRFKDR
ncbi:MAG: hypothetical protein AAF196_19175 [Planctomycetota bacterium]